MNVLANDGISQAGVEKLNAAGFKEASGISSTALGQYTEASGTSSTAMGYHRC